MVLLFQNCPVRGYTTWIKCKQREIFAVSFSCFVVVFFFWRAQVNYEHYPKMVVANHRSLVFSFTIVCHLSFVFIAVYLLRPICLSFLSLVFIEFGDLISNFVIYQLLWIWWLSEMLEEICYSTTTLLIFVALVWV